MLEYMDQRFTDSSIQQELSKSEVKSVAKRVLQALSIMYASHVVYIGECCRMQGL